MPAACKIGDNHACGAIDTGGSTDTFINGMGAHRIGDGHNHSSAVMITGSSTVIINGKGACRIGDLHSGCPNFDPNHPQSPEITGSSDTFFG